MMKMCHAFVIPKFVFAIADEAFSERGTELKRLKWENQSRALVVYFWNVFIA